MPRCSSIGLMSEETFDLRDVLANRKYPTVVVSVWIDEDGFFQLAALERKAADTTSKTGIADLDRKIKNLKKQLNDEAIKVHLRGTSRRSREDMITEAMVQYPIRRDVMGREDELQAYRRASLLTELYFAAHIQKVESASGQVQVLDDDNRRDVARSLLSELPELSVKLIDTAIANLRGEAEMQQGVDFLSAT
jgi:hypothetical protein